MNQRSSCIGNQTMHNGAVFVSRERPLLNSGTTIIIHPDGCLARTFFRLLPWIFKINLEFAELSLPTGTGIQTPTIGPSSQFRSHMALGEDALQADLHGGPWSPCPKFILSPGLKSKAWESPKSSCFPKSSQEPMLFGSLLNPKALSEPQVFLNPHASPGLF